MKKKLELPKFKNEDAERDFWAKIDLTDYYDSSDLVPVSFPNLKPTTKPVSIRFSTSIISRLKEKANAINVPYQSLIKQYVADGLEKQTAKK